MVRKMDFSKKPKVGHIADPLNAEQCSKACDVWKVGKSSGVPQFPNAACGSMRCSQSAQNKKEMVSYGSSVVCVCSELWGVLTIGLSLNSSLLFDVGMNKFKLVKNCKNKQIKTCEAKVEHKTARVGQKVILPKNIRPPVLRLS